MTVKGQSFEDKKKALLGGEGLYWTPESDLAKSSEDNVYNLTEQEQMEKYTKVARLKEVRESENSEYDDTYELVFDDVEREKEMIMNINGNLKGKLSRLILDVTKDQIEEDEETNKRLNELMDIFKTGGTFEDLDYVEENDLTLVIKYIGKDKYHSWTGIRFFA